MLPFGRLWYGDANAAANAVGYAQHFSRSHDAVIRVYDELGNVIETHQHKGDFKEFQSYSSRETHPRSIVLLRRRESLSVEEILTAGRPPQKQKNQGGKDR